MYNSWNNNNLFTTDTFDTPGRYDRSLDYGLKALWDDPVYVASHTIPGTNILGSQLPNTYLSTPLFIGGEISFI